MAIDKKTPVASWRKMPRNVWAVTLTSFLTDASSEMLTNLMPLFLGETLGVRTVVIGLIEGVAEATASLLKVASGWWSDKIRARKWLTVGGYGISTIAKPFLFFAAGWPAVLAVRFFDRVGKGIRTAPRDALVADSIESERRGLAFGLHRAGDTAGALVGILMALAVVRMTQGDAAGLARSTFQMAVVISFIPALLGVIALAVMAREVPQRGRAARLSLSGFDRRFWGFIAVMVLFTLGNSSDAFIILRARERGLTITDILLMTAAFSALYAAVSGPAGALSDRVGRKKLLVAGWLAYAAIYFGLAGADSGWQVWLLYAIYGIYYGLTAGTGKALIADIVPAERRGTAYGIFNAAIGIAVLPASVLAGVLWQGVGSWPGFGPAAPFYCGALLAGAASVALLFLPAPSRK